MGLGEGTVQVRSPSAHITRGAPDIIGVLAISNPSPLSVGFQSPLEDMSAPMVRATG